MDTDLRNLISTMLGDGTADEVLTETRRQAAEYVEKRKTPENEEWRERLCDEATSDLVMCRSKAIFMHRPTHLQWPIRGEVLDIPVKALDYTLATRVLGWVNKRLKGAS